MNYFFNKTMKTTSLNTIPFKSLLALLIQLKAKPKFKGQNEGGGMQNNTLSPYANVHCHRYDRFKKLYSLYVIWRMHRRWQQIESL